MNRRELLLGAAAMAAAATAGKAFAAEHDHDHMMSMAHDHKSTRNEKLIAAASDCALKANICVQHCIVLMGQGEKDLAACAQSSSQAAAICTALQQLASAESSPCRSWPRWRWTCARNVKKNARRLKNIPNARRARKHVWPAMRNARRSRRSHGFFIKRKGTLVVPFFLRVILNDRPAARAGMSRALSLPMARSLRNGMTCMVYRVFKTTICGIVVRSIGLIGIHKNHFIYRLFEM